MAGIKLNTLPSATVVQDDDYLMIEQREGTKKTKVSDINKKTNDLVKSLDTKVVETENNISTLSSQMEEIKTEVDEASIDFNKIPHNNLQERLTTDFGDINDRLNNAEIMEFDGSDINAKTFAGYTKEIEIRGNTWQNLLGRKTKNDTGTGLLNTIVVKDNIITIKRDITEEPDTHVGFYIKLPKEMIKKNTVYTIATMIVKNTLSSNTLLIDAPYTGFNLNVSITGRTEGIFKKTMSTDNGLLKNEIWCWTGRTTPESGEIVFTIPIILEGDYTNKPIPEEYFEGIMSTGEAEMVNGKYKVGVESSGKNLFDITDMYKRMDKINPSAYIKIQNGIKFTMSSTIFNETSLSDCYKPNTTYTITHKYKNKIIDKTGWFIKIYYMDGSAVAYYTQGTGDSKRTTDSTKSVRDICISYGTPDSECELYNIQIEEGTTATPYEPHQKDSTSYLLDEPLRSLPNGVQDTISKDGVLSRRVGNVVLDDDIDWSMQTDSTNTIKYAWGPKSVNKHKSKTVSFGVCSTVPYIQYNSDDIFHCRFDGSQPYGYFMMWIEKTKLQTQDVPGFKKWLQDNPTTVYYELSEPVTTNLKKKPTLKVYEGVTYIKSTNSIKADLAVKLPCNVNLMLSDSLKENKLLKDNIQALEVENRNINEKQDSNLSILSDMDTNLVSTSWDMDFRLMEVEFFIEDNSPQTMLKNNKPNRGGNVMALSRFEQAKIMILGGVYVRETLEHQLNTYLKRGYMTKEEVDELIAMMDARELVEGN